MRGLYIPQNPDNPVYVWVVQFQRENDLIPQNKEFDLRENAAQFLVGELSNTRDLVFSSITRRLA